MSIKVQFYNELMASPKITQILAIFTAIFIPLFPPPFGRAPVRADLHLKDDKLSALRLERSPLFSLGYSSLLKCHKLPDLSE